MLDFIKRLFSRKKAPPAPLKCPYCGGIEWHEGPSGGMSTSIMCGNPECEHWFTFHQWIIPLEDLHRTGRD